MPITRRAWSPSLTSQFFICPIPFHIDAYRGCNFNCTYCFARDFTTFHRKDKPFTYLEGNDPEAFARWCKRAMAAEPAPTRSAQYFFYHRVPIKVGATSDPCPKAELTEKITRSMLETLREYDYPTELQTKNPDVLDAVLEGMEGSNLTLSVSLITLDDVKLKKVEPNAPLPQKRLDAIKRITDRGFHVMVKCQPALYPMIMDEIEPLVDAVKAAGAWAFQMEGLKIRVTMPKEEQAIIAAVEEVGGAPEGMSVRDYYRTHGVRTGSDWELTHEIKLRYHEKARELAHARGLTYFASDNDCSRVGDSPECCGTEKLRNYQTLRMNLRTIAHETRTGEDKGPATLTDLDLSRWQNKASEVVIDFTRTERLRGMTVTEAVRAEIAKNGLSQATGRPKDDDDLGTLAMFAAPAEA